MWSEDVARERETQRTLAPTYPRPSAKSYKEQALRELATRLEQEETIRVLQQIKSAAIDLLDGLDIDKATIEEWGLTAGAYHRDMLRKLAATIKD